MKSAGRLSRTEAMVETCVASVSPDPVESAKAASLRYVTDSAPGIRRVRRGTGFVYIGSNGKVIRDADELRRFKSLVIPPAWTDVWICPSPNGHLQAVGTDAAGRRQYRYHPRWVERRRQDKHERVLALAERLPDARRRSSADLARRGMPREKAL